MAMLVLYYTFEEPVEFLQQGQITIFDILIEFD